MASNVTEWSATAASNISLGAQTIAENQMLPSGVNNAFRELMAQVAAGIAAGDFVSANPQFTTVELGHATDTTLARSAAGVVTIEGVEIVTLSRTQTLTNKTLTTPALTDPTITGAILEDIYTITDGAGFEIDPGNGSIQTITLGANRTPAATNFANGESVTLMIDDGTAYTVTWTTVDVNWTGGSAPTLATSGWTVVELWKVGGQIFGAHVGDVAA